MQIRRRQFSREAHWTEALAVGSEDFVAVSESQFPQRRLLTRYPLGTGADSDAWAVREPPTSYDCDSPAEQPL